MTKKKKNKNKSKCVPLYTINYQALIFAILAWLIVLGCVWGLFVESPKSVKEGSDICVGILLFITIALIQMNKIKMRCYKNSKPQLFTEITPKEILNEPKKVAILTPNEQCPNFIAKWGLANLNQEIVFSKFTVL